MRCLAVTALLAACASAPDTPPSPGAGGPAGSPVAMPSAPLPTSERVTRLAFGSCNRQYQSQTFWPVIAATEPDAFVYLGDNVYGDVATDDPALPELRAAYAELAAAEEFARFRRAVPVLPVWDDHDYGRNDAGRDFPLRTQAEALFEDVWVLPADDPRRARPGVYHAEAFGPPGERVQVVLLDTRYFRSALTPTDQRGAPGKERYLPSGDPAQTMLGDEQLAWLEGVLAEPADLRVLVSSVQVLADGHGFEGWATLPAARQRLYDLLARAQRTGPPILLVSGDRHRGGLYRTAHDGQTLTEMTASSLNDAFPGEEEAGPNRLGPTVTAENFGLLDLDWAEGVATMTLLGMDGEAFQSVAVPIRD